MTWAQSFNSGQMANHLSNSMSNISLNTDVSPAQTQALLNKNLPNGANFTSSPIQDNFTSNQMPNNMQIQNTIPQASYQQPVQNGFNQQPAQFQPYQATPQYTQPVNNFTQYSYPAPQYSYPTAQYSYPMPQYVQQPVYMQPQPVQPMYVQPQVVQPVYVQPQQVQPAVQQPQVQENPQPAAVEPASQAEVTTPQIINTPTQPGSNLDINTSDISNENKSDKLKKYYYNAKLGQGVLAKTVDWTKGIFNIDGTSKKANAAIKKYEKGEISYEEALKEISKFTDKQKSNSDAAANIISGTAGLLAAISASSKGKGTGASIALATAAGALSKGLSMIAERGTNGIAGDALSVKGIIKDSITGAANGAITGGVTKVVVGGKEFGAMNGAITGAISGGGIGYTNYMADVITDENKKFSFSDAGKQTLNYAIGGAVIGGAVGMAHSKFNTKTEKPNNQPETEPPKNQTETEPPKTNEQTAQTETTDGVKEDKKANNPTDGNSTNEQKTGRTIEEEKTGTESTTSKAQTTVNANPSASELNKGAKPINEDEIQRVTRSAYDEKYKVALKETAPKKAISDAESAAEKIREEIIQQGGTAEEAERKAREIYIKTLEETEEVSYAMCGGQMTKSISKANVEEAKKEAEKAVETARRGLEKSKKEIEEIDNTIQEVQEVIKKAKAKTATRREIRKAQMAIHPDQFADYLQAGYITQDTFGLIQKTCKELLSYL